MYKHNKNVAKYGLMSYLCALQTLKMYIMINIILIVFIIGYLFITLEHKFDLNKSASALLTAFICWSLYALLSPDIEHVIEHLNGHLHGIAEIVFFLLGAMTIVEMIAVHNGFELLTEKITTKNKRTLLWIICIITFFLSAILDNLTTAIVMVSLLQKLLSDRQDRLIFSGLVVIAANAGGAWSPMGDVTTTMLWIGNQVTASHLLLTTFLPSIVCLLIPLLLASRHVKGSFERPIIEPNDETTSLSKNESRWVLLCGLLCLINVPIFKTITHLPPYMGMLGGLGILWVFTELLHRHKEDKTHLRITSVITKIDVPSVMFFLGILLAVACLESIGFLGKMALFLEDTIHNKDMIVTFLGLLSAVVDNVPLTAAVQAMYDLQTYPTDHKMWAMLAYAVGTGGSCLIIGSAAGVVVMGIENISFGWYLRHISLWALLGYLGGMGVFWVLYHTIII